MGIDVGLVILDGGSHWYAIFVRPCIIEEEEVYSNYAGDRRNERSDELIETTAVFWV